MKGLPLDFTTSAAALFVRGYTAYLVFVPLAFVSSAATGWIVSRSHSRAMVLVWALFFVIASIVAFAVYAVFPLDRMPLPELLFHLAVDFVIAPIGILAGGLSGPLHAKSLELVDRGE